MAMAKYAEMNERAAPHKRSVVDARVSFSLVMRFIICKVAAARIVGIDISMEKRAAPVREKPKPLAAVIVMPERLVPGIRASTCARPIIKA